MRRKVAGDLAALNRNVARYSAPVGLILALLAAATELLAGPGTRLDLWYYRTGLAMFGIAAVMGMLGAVISLISGLLAGTYRTAYRMAIAGVIIGLVAAGIPWSWSRAAKQVPGIHDISTDTVDPPAFSALLPLRKNAENSVDYGGQDVAARQKMAYPDIQPLMLPLPVQTAFDRAVKVAREMRWNIVSLNGPKNRIEATATTFWFGFKDDVVVRVTPEKEGSRVDIRSLSRVGVSDLGTNARRIRTFLEKMKAG
jgi:uncharacterized protein (DUF1499 family)